ncbi:LexA family protein [Campylobacter devanensis]|uniref:LexA family protein n=1 Tax=Campylobacter devanensis TaxID=3161138 RepID=UPI000A32D403|nr:S24 family peptidase [Campylobacter sp. P0106]
MFASNLDNIIKKAGFSSSESFSTFLSEQFSYNISKESITKYRNGTRTPDPKFIEIVLKATGEDASALFGGQQSNIKFVPIVGSASCGIPLPNSYQDIENKAFCKSEIWHSDLYAIIANGDSMIPEIDDGDEVICDPKADILSGDIVHYQINDESAIKVFFKDENIGVIEFVPFNQNGDFKTLKFRIDDDSVYIKMSKVIAINKSKMNNRQARLKAINRI